MSHLYMLKKRMSSILVMIVLYLFVIILILIVACNRDWGSFDPDSTIEYVIKSPTLFVGTDTKWPGPPGFDLDPTYAEYEPHKYFTVQVKNPLFRE